ncbi:hypothetical protein COOONC_24297 [Cooperia oncophora]
MCRLNEHPRRLRCQQCTVTSLQSSPVTFKIFRFRSQFRRPTRPGPPSSALPVRPPPPRLRKPPQRRRRPRPARREPTPSTQQSRAQPLQNNSRPRSRGPGEAVPQRNLARPLASVPQRRQALRSRNSTFS